MGEVPVNQAEAAARQEFSNLLEQILKTESIVNPRLRAYAFSKLSDMTLDQLKDVAAGRVPIGYPQGMVAKALVDSKSE